MFTSGIATVGAFLLIGLGATRESKGALYTLSGFLLMACALYLHTQAYTGVLTATAAISAEIGVGFFVLAGLLSRHRKQARPFFYFGSIALLVAVVLFGWMQVTSDRTLNTPQTLLVELGPDDSISELHQTLTEHGATTEKAFPAFDLNMDQDLAQVYIVSVSASRLASLIDALKEDGENVDHVELNFDVSLQDPIAASSDRDQRHDVLEDDPLVANQWGLDAIQGHQAHALLKDLSPERKARVAILDTGVDAGHEDVAGTFAASPATADPHGHGSHCAGLAGAVTNNGIGIASLNWEGRFVEISSYQALNESGIGMIEMISQAILDATRDDADVISMSLGAKADTPKVIRDAIGFARRNNTIVLASAGNANEDAADHMPSNVEGVIVVSAVDEKLEKASFSNTNMSLSRPITAPGVNMLSLKTGGGYVPMSGTSMSTPLVAGLVGIMRALNPDITEDAVYNILSRTGKNVKDSARIGKLIDAEASIQSVLSGR